MKFPLLPIITLVLGGVIGFMVEPLGIIGQKPQDRNEERNSRVRQRAGGRPLPVADAVLSDFLKGRSPADLTAEEAHRLLMPLFKRHVYDTTRDSTREGVLENYQLRLLMAKLPLPVLEQTLELARDGSIPFFRTHEAFAAYAIRDWDRAMAWAARQRDKRDLNAAAISWLAETEPDRATRLYQQALLDDVVQYDSVTVSKLARHHALRGSAAYLDFLDSLPSLEDKKHALRAMNDLQTAEIPTFLEAYVLRRMEGRFGGTGYLFDDILSRRPEQIEEIYATLEKAYAKISAESSSSTSAAPSDHAKPPDSPEEEADFLMKAIDRFSQDENLAPEDIEILTSLLATSELTVEDTAKANEAIEKLRERFSKPTPAK